MQAPERKPGQNELNKGPEKLKPSLQETLGMVSSPEPKKRNIPHDTKFSLMQVQTYSTENELDFSAVQICIVNRWIPKLKGNIRGTENFQRLQNNVASCQNRTISLSVLQQYIKNKKRIDMEQSVALVISITEEKEARKQLVIEAQEIIMTSYMWLEDQDKIPDFFTQEQRTRLLKIQKIQWNLENLSGEMEDFDSYRERVGKQTLFPDYTAFFENAKKLHRKRPALKNRQVLYMPPDVMSQNKIQVSYEHQRSYREKPTALNGNDVEMATEDEDNEDYEKMATENQEKLANLKMQDKDMNSENEKVTKENQIGQVIQEEPVKSEQFVKQEAESGKEVPKIMSKNKFKRINKYLGRMAGKKDKESVYHRQIQELIDAFYNKDQIALMNTKDVLSFCFSFTNFMRRLQPKIVSNVTGLFSGSFLKKDETKQIQQNTPQKLTSFEVVLSKLAMQRVSYDEAALTCVIIPPQYPNNKQQDETRMLELVDWCCLLMEEYVKVYTSNNRMDELVFKQGSSGGKGRGAIDRYNGLVDVLRDIKQRCHDIGIKIDVKPCHKFLAKDIMHWNDAWNDDAFASNKIPGWKIWLDERRQKNQLIKAHL